MSFLDADYSAIEARIVNWLAGQEDALEEYRQGVDRYKRMASVIYGIPEERVNKHPQRFIGKQCILLSGFQGGPAKFRQTCEKFGYKDMPAGLEDTAVGAFRAKHKKVVQYWYDVEKAAKQAVLYRNTHVSVRNVSFVHKDIEGMRFLLCVLPSGRKLAYPRPRIVPSRKFPDRTMIEFYGHIIGAQWGSVDTYGGKLVENITQAVAADVMAHGAHNCERAGYEIATLIHDEVIVFKRNGETPDRLVKLLTTLPDWAKNLPIEAEGEEIPFYLKS